MFREYTGPNKCSLQLNIDFSTKHSPATCDTYCSFIVHLLAKFNFNLLFDDKILTPGTLFITRACAWRGPNTPGWHHFLMYKNNLSLWQWYKAKSMEHEIYVADPHIFHKVDLWVTLVHYPKYKISPSNSLQDMKQNRCSIKYRSLTYTYFISIYVP